MAKLFSLAPLRSGLRRRLRTGYDIFAGAEEAVELAPAETREAPAAIALPGEIERAAGVYPGTTLAAERLMMTAPEWKHEATTAFRFSNVLLAHDTIYLGGHDIVCGEKRRRLFIWDDVERVGEGQYCGDFGHQSFFGHWLRTGLLKEALAAQRGMTPLNFARRPWRHEEGYRQLTGLRDVQVSAARVKSLWLVDDRGLNANWIERFRMLRGRIRGAAKGGPSHVYLARGSTGASREVLNADELIEHLVRRGFAMLEPEKMEPSAIAQALAGADLVVSVEGSALNHAHYALPPSAAMIAIQPPYRFNAYHKQVADAAGFRFGFVVADPGPGGFRVDIERLLRTMDLAAGAIGRSH